MSKILWTQDDEIEDYRRQLERENPCEECEDGGQPSAEFSAKYRVWTIRCKKCGEIIAEYDEE